MPLSAMSFGDWFCISRKGGTGKVGGFTCRVKKAWPYLGLAVERPLLALDGHFWHE